MLSIYSDFRHLSHRNGVFSLLLSQPLPLLWAALYLPSRNQQLQVICLWSTFRWEIPIHSSSWWKEQSRQLVWRPSLRGPIICSSSEYLRNPWICYWYFFSYILYLMARQKMDYDTEPSFSNYRIAPLSSSLEDYGDYWGFPLWSWSRHFI